ARGGDGEAGDGERRGGVAARLADGERDAFGFGGGDGAAHLEESLDEGPGVGAGFGQGEDAAGVRAGRSPAAVGGYRERIDVLKLRVPGEILDQRETDA